MYNIFLQNIADFLYYYYMPLRVSAAWQSPVFYMDT